jgi:flagellar biogenesis protein FliO
MVGVEEPMILFFEAMLTVFGPMMFVIGIVIGIRWIPARFSK